MNNSITKILSATIATLLAASAANAATATGTLQVSLTTSNTCTISAPPLAFGVFTGAEKTAASTVSVYCNGPLPFSIAMSAGAGVGASISNGRKLTRPGGSTLTYNLYSDASYATIWGDGNEEATVPGVGIGLTTPATKTVYGKVSEASTFLDGTYSDAVVMTVTY